MVSLSTGRVHLMPLAPTLIPHSYTTWQITKLLHYKRGRSALTERGREGEREFCIDCFAFSLVEHVHVPEQAMMGHTHFLQSPCLAKRCIELYFCIRHALQPPTVHRTHGRTWLVCAHSKWHNLINESRPTSV